MYGFPQDPSLWEAKHYVRIVLIICSYLVLRPMLQKIFGHFDEKKRLKEKKAYDDEQIRKHKQQRIREKLGITGGEDVEVTEEVEETTKGATTTSRKSVSALLQKRRPLTDKEKIQQILDTFESDEDVSDLI